MSPLKKRSSVYAVRKTIFQQTHNMLRFQNTLTKTNCAEFPPLKLKLFKNIQKIKVKDEIKH